VLQQHTTLKTLCGFLPGQLKADFSGSELGPTDSILIAADLRLNRSLLTLNLSSNALGADGAAALAKALEVNSALTYLDVSSNSITDSGMQKIGASLLRSTTSKLGALKCDAFDLPAGAQSLRSKTIGPAAATLLAGVLKLSQTLTTLDLSSSGICQTTSTQPKSRVSRRRSGPRWSTRAVI